MIRWHLCSRSAPLRKSHRRGSLSLVVLLITVLSLSAILTQSVRAAPPVPVFAYYSIWFDPTSWNRAKSDYPILGRYSSDDRAVMQQHLRWAKQVGITGFIVSWKSTPTLNRRLDQLADLATSEGFHLAIIYQGLTFERDPLPVERIASDLRAFCQRWGGRNVFNDIFGKPVIIWSGTWAFSVEEVQFIRKELGNGALLLPSERNVAGYLRLAHLVDGNAYYWSSVDPTTYSNYLGKLQELSQTIHERGGIWIAPAAPGFDARLIGGTRVVERRRGETLRQQLSAAFASSPNAIGIISWNEFSENTHIEPSVSRGNEALRTLASALGTTAPELPALGSEALPTTGPSYGLPLLGTTCLLLIGSIGLLFYRRRRVIRRRRSPRQQISNDQLAFTSRDSTAQRDTLGTP